MKNQLLLIITLVKKLIATEYKIGANIRSEKNNKPGPWGLHFIGFR